jgi:hypothetical protein
MSDTQTNMYPPGEKLSFEKVWDMFQETGRKIEESRKLIEESRKEFEAKCEADWKYREAERQQRKEREEKLDKQMKITDRRIGEMSNRFGELAEHLVLPSIQEKFNALGYDFDKTSQNVGISDKLDSLSGAEIDILLENGDIAIAVEVKAKPLYKDIDRHLERMEVLRRWANKHDDRRKFRGAMAGAIMSDEVRKYILKAGFYVIEQTGDTVEIIVPRGFTPREW